MAAAPQSSVSPTPPNPEPTPITLAKVPLEAESTTAALQEINDRRRKRSVRRGPYRRQPRYPGGRN